jgi:hypothetical protein
MQQNPKTDSIPDQLLDIAGLCLGVWFLGYPHPYDLCLGVILLAPWVALYFMRRSKGISFGALVCFPVGMAAIAAYRTYDLYEFSISALWTLAGATVGVMFLAWLFVQKAIDEEAERLVALLGIAFLAIAYSYGAMINTNCHYDRSEAGIWPVQVMTKRKTHGSRDHYYITISPWGKYANQQEKAVDDTLYNSVNPGDSIKVCLKEGKWGVSWYYLSGH